MSLCLQFRVLRIPAGMLRARHRDQTDPRNRVSRPRDLDCSRTFAVLGTRATMPELSTEVEEGYASGRWGRCAWASFRKATFRTSIHDSLIALDCTASSRHPDSHSDTQGALSRRQHQSNPHPIEHSNSPPGQLSRSDHDNEPPIRDPKALRYLPTMCTNPKSRHTSLRTPC